MSDRLAGSLSEWWKLGFEIRGRADNYLGLNGVAGQDETYYPHRFRLDSMITIRPWLRISTQAQDSRAVDYDRRPVPGTVANTADLRQAYLDWVSMHCHALRPLGTAPVRLGKHHQGV